MPNIIAVLLGTGRAWRARTGTYLRDLLDAIVATAVTPIQVVANRIFTDLLVNETTKIEQLEQQYALFGEADTPEIREARLLAAIQATGGTGVAYIEGVMATAGFDIKVHDGFIMPGQYRDPRVYLQDNGITNYKTTMGRSTAIMSGGADQSEIMGRRSTLNGYVLTVKGQPHVIPPDSTTWPYFIYIGGTNFGDVVTVPASRREEFERLIRQITPGHLWLGIFAEFV